MSDYKSRVIKYESKSGTKYRVDYAYKGADGKYHNSCKRGFSLMREATSWQKNMLPILVADLEQKGTSKKNADEEMLFSELVDEYMKRSELRRKETTCGTKENIIKNRILPFY